MSDPAWRHAMTALSLIAVDPGGLGGLILRARAGPVRQIFEATLARLPGAHRRLPPSLSDTQLFGGLNVAASLSQGQAVWEPGLFETPSLLTIPMAERIGPGLAGRLAQVMDAARGHALVLLDEGAEADEAAPDALGDRLAFFADLTGVAHGAAVPLLPAPADLDAARGRLAGVTVPDDALVGLTALAGHFGIASLRAPLLAIRAARAHAVLEGRMAVDDADIRLAAELVFAHRATVLPEPIEPEEPDAPPEESADQDSEAPGEDDGGILDDRLVEAVLAHLPPGLLHRLEAGTRSKGSGSGAGARRKGNRRGRPLPARPGRADGRARIDVVATLRAAAPWQPLRRKLRPNGPPIILFPNDIRLKRYEDRSDRLLVFLVDASGSAALARLGEAKGAVELLLAEAYAQRDHVALIAFRGTGAEMLLPPTRSLVQAKRRLSALPGGGGTPLAAGLAAALTLAVQARGRGMSPALVTLTDGRANVALSGAGGRNAAQADAETLAAQFRAQGFKGLVIDTATRPGPATATLAAQMGAEAVVLPRADAQTISAAVSQALD